MQALVPSSPSPAPPSDAVAGTWLRSPAFDSVMVFGVLAVALAMGSVAYARPALFPVVLALDVWLFAYPHVTSTYTRIAFDSESARRHWFLLLGLPPLVLAGTAGIAALGGAGGLFTVYFIGQTYHYTRQSYGIARSYRRTLQGPATRDWLSDGVVYAFPIWGLLHRAAQGHAAFYDNPLYLPKVPGALAGAVGLVAICLFAAWSIREARLWATGTRRVGHASFVVTHVFITTLAYVLVDEITAGWLFVNIWHNAQYLLFVWAFNAKRFSSGVEPARPFLSRLCQPRNAWAYAVVCVLFGAGLYALLGEAGARVSLGVLPVVLVLHLTVNFHHYLVDGVIWTRRRVAPAAASTEASAT